MAIKQSDKEKRRKTGGTAPQKEREETKLEVKKKEEDHARGVQWMLTAILGLSGIALICSAVYGFQYSLKGAILAVLASTLGYTIGGIAGFLFGFPRYTDSASISSAADLQAATAASSSVVRASALRHNTNLERITDWLMTMIIGATLVNLQELVAWAELQFRSITAAVVYSGLPDFPDSVDTYAAPGAVLVLPLMAAGFLHMYMWARKYLLPEWLALDKALQQDVAKLEENQQTQQAALEKLRTSIYSVDPTYLARYEELLERLGVEKAVLDDIIARYENAESWNDDPFRNFGPPEAEGFRLSATVVRDEANRNNPYRVTIAIQRIDDAEFAADIALLLHNSFRSPVIVEPNSRGKQFHQTISCAEPFALGAVLVLEKTQQNIRLGLDLAALRNLPEGFTDEERQQPAE